ncbi:WD40-repeat-containing domain protein [Coprinopsis sp. MPI-PUGE-AT-0042]|nr:WD40-repeat-containing domain protein [Coprinopsis sp. MPI-PUGE-AT-0042]
MQQREREMREFRERDRRERERVDFRERERRDGGGGERTFTFPPSSRGDEPSSRPSTSSNSLKPPGDPSQGSGVGQKRPLSSPSASASTASFRPPGPPGFAGLGPMAATPKLPPVPGTTNTGGVGGGCTLGGSVENQAGKEATADTSPFRATSMVPAPPDSRESKPPNMAYYRSSTGGAHTKSSSSSSNHQRSHSGHHLPHHSGVGTPHGDDEDYIQQREREAFLERITERGLIFPDDYSGDMASLPGEYRKEGLDWYAMFNPRMKSVRQVMGRGGPLGVVKKGGLDVDLVHTLIHESVVCCVRFSHDGKSLATGCNRTVQIYDTRTGQKMCVLMDDSVSRQGDLYIRSVCFSPDGALLATGAEDKIVRVWDIAKRRIHAAFDGHQQEIYSLEFSFDGRLVVSGSGDKTVRIWDLVTNDCTVLTISDIVPAPNPPSELNGTDKEGQGDGMDVDSSDDKAGVDSEKQVQQSSNANSQDAGVTSVGISPDARFVAAGSLDHAVRVWEVKSTAIPGTNPPKFLRTGTLVERLRGHGDSVYSVAFTPDGRGLVSGSLDRTIRYWDLSHLGIVGTTGKTNGSPSKSSSSLPTSSPAREGNKELNHPGYIGLALCTKVFAGHKDYVLSVSVSGDGQWVVSGSKDRGVQWWDLGSVGRGGGSPTNGAVASRAVGDSAEEGAQSDIGSEVVVRERREGREDDCACLLQGHKNSVISIDLSPAGGLLATGSGDWQARIWSYKTVT